MLERLPRESPDPIARGSSGSTSTRSRRSRRSRSTPTVVDQVYPSARGPAGKPAEVLSPLLGPDEPGRGLHAHPPARMPHGKAVGRPVPGAGRGALVDATGRGSRCCSIRAGSSAGSSHARRSGRSWSREVVHAGRSTSAGPTRRAIPLAREFRKSFRAGPPDETPPDPRDLEDPAPAAGTRDPLDVDVPRAARPAPWLERLIVVRDAEGRIVQGAVDVEGGGDTSGVHARAVWTAGDYSPRCRHRAGRPGG